MSSLLDFKNTLKSSLEEKGLLKEVRAIVRANVFKVLQSDIHEKPAIETGKQLFCNEIILEYLKFFKYDTTASVFLEESNHPKESFSKEFMVSQFGNENMKNAIKENSEIPILLLLMSILDGGKEKQQQNKDRRKQPVKPTRRDNPNEIIIEGSGGRLDSLSEHQFSEEPSSYSKKDQSNVIVISK